LKPLLDRGRLSGLAHITGGGLTDNLPRILPGGCSAHIQLNSWTEPPIFGVLQELGRIDEAEMLRTFNMGIGMALIVSPGEVSKVEENLARSGEPLYRIGEIRSGKRRVYYRR